MNGESIVIIGSRGFLGKALVQRFKGQGHEVRAICRSTFPIYMASLKSTNLLNPSSVVWVASSVNPATAEQDKESIDRDLNEWVSFIDSIKELPMAARPYLVFVSSGGCIYSEEKISFTEEDVALGVNAYGRVKAEQERLLIESGINSVILRVANVYGPGQPSGRGQGVIAEWKESIRKSGSINIFGDLNQKRDFLFIQDFIDVVEKVIFLQPNGVFNIGSGEAVSLEELVVQLTNCIQSQIDIRKSNSRQEDRFSYKLDISKAKEVLNWYPKTTLREGLAMTIHR